MNIQNCKLVECEPQGTVPRFWSKVQPTNWLRSTGGERWVTPTNISGSIWVKSKKDLFGYVDMFPSWESLFAGPLKSVGNHGVSPTWSGPREPHFQTHPGIPPSPNWHPAGGLQGVIWTAMATPELANVSLSRAPWCNLPHDVYHLNACDSLDSIWRLKFQSTSSPLKLQFGRVILMSFRVKIARNWGIPGSVRK